MSPQVSLDLNQRSRLVPQKGLQSTQVAAPAMTFAPDFSALYLSMFRSAEIRLLLARSATPLAMIACCTHLDLCTDLLLLTDHMQ